MEDQNKQEYHFLKEETKKIPTNKKKLCKKLGIVIVFAAIFGVVACLVFCMLKPVIEQKQQERAEAIRKEQEQTAPPVDEPEQIVVQETIEPTIQGYEALHTQLYSIGNMASKSVVEINSVTSGKDWFEDDYESKGQSSGVIVQDEGGEVLILTETDMISNANSIQVTFYDNEKAPAYLKAYDGSTGIAIVAVDEKDLKASTKTVIAAIERSEVSSITPGSFVIGIGSPQGKAYSVMVGNVTASNNKVSFYDGNYRLITTSIEAYEDTRGVLLNVDGKAVGLVCQGEENDALRAVAISDLDAILDKLMEGKRPAFLGVEVSEVTVSVSEEYGLPDGVYIKKVAMDSPALLAGLQVGDIIVKVDGKELLTEAQYEKYIAAAAPEQKMSVTVMRQGNNGQYQEVNCKVTLGVKE